MEFSRHVSGKHLTPEVISASGFWDEVLERSGLQELPRAEVKKVELSGIEKSMDIKQVEFSAHRAWLWDTERL